MSNEELQNIIQAAVEARLPHPVHQVTSSEEPQSNTDTAAQEVQSVPETQAQPLAEDDIENVISDMFSSSDAISPLSDAVAVNVDEAAPDGDVNVQLYGVVDAIEGIRNIEEMDLPEQVTVQTEAAAEESQESNEDILELEEPEEASIPNIEGVDTSETTSRFRGADWFEIVANKTIILAGLGGIGSWAALLLSRLHPSELRLYDADTIERVNLSGQLYGIEEVTRRKVDVTAEHVRNFSDYYNVVCYPTRFEVDSQAGPIMISGFDNMESRKLYYHVWKSYILTHPEIPAKNFLYIDARMSAEEIQILCITGEDEAYMREYEEKWLFSDSEADAEVCSYKQTSFCAAIIGGLITNLFVNYCANLGDSFMPRTLPFLTTYDATTMFLNAKN